MNPSQLPSKCLISVAGMVGIGKTTFARALAGRLHFRTSLEKVDGNPYLDAFYKDFERWVFQLQIYFLGERFKENKRMDAWPGGFVQDRSIYEDTGIFARMHYEKGTMSEADYRTYTSLFDAMVMTPYFHHPDLLIYLHGSLDATIKRIRSRGRGSEKETPVSYWQEMFQRYEQWIAHFNTCPVLKIDIDDYDLIYHPDSLDSVIPLIEEKLASEAGKKR
ncbi:MULTISPECIES: deoxynucleoside kinase [unclassified Sporolactobacillus]|uniref:deoxynucleoside kinase n=1 Tax=unclassified Sporolactobacillus TaxID=2628533 RepID=UPI00236752DF|nr:deoxynucleoside kinase [Sporolactobacillus sp. CQH2019]MDD9148510.1 deoxynucleoside kinase [Sporolactobacillus sp. CQH2019]